MTNNKRKLKKNTMAFVTTAVIKETKKMCVKSLDSVLLLNSYSNNVRM